MQQEDGFDLARPRPQRVTGYMVLMTLRMLSTEVRAMIALKPEAGNAKHCRRLLHSVRLLHPSCWKHIMIDRNPVHPRPLSTEMLKNSRPGFQCIQGTLDSALGPALRRHEGIWLKASWDRGAVFWMGLVLQH